MKLVSRSNKEKKSNAAQNQSAAANGRNTQNREHTANRSVVPNRNDPQNRSNAVASNTDSSTSSIDKNESKPAPNKKSHLRTVLVIVLIIALGFSGLFVSLGFYIRSLDTIFPNVWADGIKVSGMTVEEATQTLINEGYETNAEGISVTVVFPDDSSFTVSGREVGLSFDAAEAANAAFAFGREESFFRNEVTYVRSLFNRTDLHELSNPDFNDTIVRKLAADYTARFNETLIDSNIDYDSDSITIIKGTGLHPADEDEVFNFAIHTLLRAIVENEHLTADYTPERNVDDSIDLQMLFDHIHEEPVSSRYDTEIRGATGSSFGKTFDIGAAQEMLRNAELGSTIFIPIVILEPEYTKEEIESMLLRDVLSESTTTHSGDSNRLSNIQLAARNISGTDEDESSWTVLEPGDVFSFNAIVGPRTAANGFKIARVIQGGGFDMGLGGGICQVSSTIHDAVLHTFLEVVERSPHGLRISYMPKDEVSENNSIGRRFANDAMVNWGTHDYKFRNNTDFPIRVQATVDGVNLTIRLWGTKLDDTYILIETNVLSETRFVEVVEETDTMLIGESGIKAGFGGQNGFRAEIFQLHYTAGGELIERIAVGRPSSPSTYNVQNRVMLVGTAEHPPPPVYDGPSWDETEGAPGGGEGSDWE